MLFCKYILKDRIMKLEKLNKSFKETQGDIEIELQRAFANIYDIRLAMEECIVASTKPRLYTLMMNSIKAFNKEMIEIKTAPKLKEVLNNIIDLFSDFDYQDEDDTTYSYQSLSRIKTLDTWPLDPLKEHISRNNREVTLFEPDCSTGDCFQFLQSSNLLAYGTEETSDISIAKEYAAKVVRGQLKGSRIANDAFDYLIAKCSIKSRLSENMLVNSVAKFEKEYLINLNKYLRPGGIILIAIPHYRMYKDLAEIIAKNYHNVKVYKSTGAYWQEKRYLYIFAQKNTVKGFDNDAYNALRKAYNPELLEDFNEDLKLDYVLPSKHIPIETFRGSVLDMEELHYLVNNSGALDEMFDNQHVEKIGESSTRPLLPFNIGQIGLVLTSGCLDGIIDEGDGHYHLVKGQVSKKSDIESNISNGTIDETEIISNRVEINIMLPNGEFKTLA